MYSSLYKQDKNTQTGRRVLVLLFLELGRHATIALPQGVARHPLYSTGGWEEPQGQSGRVRKIFIPTGIRSLDRPARGSPPDQTLA